MMHGPPGTGIPNAYPLAINSPLDRAYLRPLQEPIYDTEVLDFTSPATSLTYFQRPISQSTAALSITKDFSETNLNQSSMLDYPREFSILGFNVVLDSTIGLLQAAVIFRRAYIQFTFSGRRPYLTCPLHRMPQGIGLSGSVASTVSAGAGNSGLVAFGEMGLPHIANVYKFNLGRAALKIKPGEAFNFKITFTVSLPTGAAGLASTLNANGGYTQATPAGWFIGVFLVGLQWSPL